MRFYGDYHTHTRYSDGLGTVADNAAAARAAGLNALAISDHGYNNPNPFSLTRKKQRKQAAEIASVRPAFPDLTIYTAIEADIIASDGSVDLDEDDLGLFDFITVGYHRWARPRSFADFRKYYLNAYLSPFRRPSASEIVRNTDTFVRCIERYPIAILAHINNYSIVDCKTVAECCAHYNTLIELNGKHIDLARADFEIMLGTDCRFIANTLKCRPPENRKPKKEEKEACEKFLHAQIKTIKPKVIVLCGATAMESFLDKKFKISKVRGEIFDNVAGYKGIKFVPILHPSYLLRQHSLDEGSPRDLTLKDLIMIKKTALD